MGALPIMLIAISMLLQGPLPVAQAATKSSTLFDSARVAVLTGMAGCLLVVTAVALLPDLRFVTPKEVTTELVWLIMGTAVLYALANLLIVMATFALGPPRFGIAFTLRVIPLAGISALALGEHFTWLSAVGDIVIVTGVLVTATIRGRDALEKQEGSDVRPPLRAWLLAAGATLAFGSANALDAAVVKHMTAITYAPIRLLLPALMTGVGLVVYWLWQRRKVAKRDRAPSWRQWLPGRLVPLTAIAVFMPISATTFMWAVQLTNKAGLLAAFHQTSLFPTIVIGAFIGGGRREVGRELKRYAFPAALCCIGVAVALTARG